MTIGVYGLGRFGAFWAAQLASRFPVKGYSRNPERRTPLSVERITAPEGFSDCDAVFLCNSISSMDAVCGELAPVLKPGTLVMDTCSVKMHPIEAMKRNFPDNISLMGTHPMFGPDSGALSISGLPIVVVNVRTPKGEYGDWIGKFREMGLRVLEMTAEEHDREAAYSQGITHFIGRMLNELPLKDSPMATTGYRALLEIIRQTCNDSWQLFVDIQRYNPFTDMMRRDLHTGLNRMLDEFDSIKSVGGKNG